MPRTLYVSDLDGTLLGPDGSLGVESTRLLNDLLGRGVLFTYATARGHASSSRVTGELRLRLPVITYGGTMTVDPRTGAPADQHLVPGSVMRAVYRPELIVFTFEEGRDWLRWETETPGTAAFLARRAGDPRLRPITPDDPVDLDAVFYVTVLGPPAELAQLRTDLAPHLAGCVSFLNDPDANTPEFAWLEFHAASGTKAAAVRRLMTSVGADRLVVFGDNNNDLLMFAIADEAYAVANAIPAVRAAATAVLDGSVARWLAEHA